MLSAADVYNVRFMAFGAVSRAIRNTDLGVGTEGQHALGGGRH